MITSLTRLFSDTSEILPGHNARARRAFERVLRERHVQVLTGNAVVEVCAGTPHDRERDANMRWTRSCG